MLKRVFHIPVVVGIALTVWLYLAPLNMVHSQGETEVKCGQIIDRDFTDDVQEHIYLLSIEPRWSFDVSIKPYGDDLQTLIALFGPTDKLMDLTDGGRGATAAYKTVSKSPTISSGILSSRGPYKISVTNTARWYGEVTDEERYYGGVGFYTISIGCTTSDGKRIAPGDNPLPTTTPAPLATSQLSSTPADNTSDFTGIGFPGLAPVDFSTVAKVPLLPDTVMTGILPTGNEILGFTLDATAGDTLDLSYTRVSGNMNLGLVVLSEDNQVFFQASLVTSESLATTFTLSTAGKYTIGVFRISLVEPDVVEPTVFQLQGSLVTAE